MNPTCNERWWPVHDIANPQAASTDAPLYCVRLDDRGDMCVYVWGGTPDDAIEEAEEHAARMEWEIDEEDAAVFVSHSDGERSAVMARCGTLTEDPDLLVLLDLTADSGAMATMNAEAAGYLGWTLNGSRIEHDGDHCYVIFGQPWDDNETDAANDEQADRDLASVLSELDGAGLPWQEV